MFCPTSLRDDLYSLIRCAMFALASKQNMINLHKPFLFFQIELFSCLKSKDSRSLETFILNVYDRKDIVSRRQKLY